MNIIGITGTIGAGKGTVVDYLVSVKGYRHFSVRNFLISYLNKHNQAINRESMTLAANELRERYGSGFIVEQLFTEALKTGHNCVIESIRTVGEIETLKKISNFTLLAVDAEINTRYERIKKRKSETDLISFDEFIESEKREMDSTNPNNQNLRTCIRMADFKIINNGSVEKLNEQIEVILSKI